MPRMLPAALLCVLLSAGGCGPAARQGPAPPQPRTTVRVQNQSFLDLNIFVLDGSGQRRRLGNVPGVSTRVFTIPSSLIFGISTLRFLADPVGGRATPVSQEIAVEAGDEIVLTIPNL